MSVAGRSRPVAAIAPLVCLTVAVIMLLRVFGPGGTDGPSSTDGLADRVADALSGNGEVSPSSPESFLADLDAPREARDGSAAVEWRASRSVSDAAAEVLRAYAGIGGAELATSGFLDLKGRSWGAVVSNDGGWVDIVAVFASGEGTGDGEWAESAVRVVRLYAAGP